MLKNIVKKILPPHIYKAISLSRSGRGFIRWGNMRRTEPVSRKFGLDRGTAIDRIYIEDFLQRNSQLIRGKVLEIGDREYSTRFGGDAIAESYCLHAEAGNDQATVVGDLVTGQGVPENTFDCFILTQTIHVIYDMRSAVKNAAKSLAPGGTLLVTLPGISQISRYDMDRWGDYWRFTPLSARKLFEEFFPNQSQLEINSYGNVFTAAAFLYGLCAEELRPEELNYHDRDYPLTITVKATKV